MRSSIYRQCAVPEPVTVETTMRPEEDTEVDPPEPGWNFVVTIVGSLGGVLWLALLVSIVLGR